MERHIEQPALTAGEHVRRPRDARHVTGVTVDEGQPTRAFGDEEGVVREEGERPGVFEPRGDRLDCVGCRGVVRGPSLRRF